MGSVYAFRASNAPSAVVRRLTGCRLQAGSMMMHTCPLAELSATIATLPDRELLVEIERLATDEHQATARLIAALGELD